MNKTFRYIVSEKETLWTMARKNRVTPGDLMLLNPDLLKIKNNSDSSLAGKEINIPDKSNFRDNMNIKKGLCTCQREICERFKLLDQQGKAEGNGLYYKISSSRETYVGRLNTQGETLELHTPTKEKVKFEILWVQGKVKKSHIKRTHKLCVATELRERQTKHQTAM